jgi:glycosidase/lysophospholipase L1-like esterase
MKIHSFARLLRASRSWLRRQLPSLFTGIMVGLLCAGPVTSKEFESVKPTPRTEHWQRRAADIDRYLNHAKDLKDVRLLFVGDSITDFWLLDDNPWVKGQRYGRTVWDATFAVPQSENYALNLGISGDRIENALQRLLPRAAGGDGQLDSPQLTPEFIVLLIGINNTWAAEEPVQDSVFEGIRAVLARLHQARPNARIVLQSLLPTNDPAKNEQVVIPVNQRIQALAATAQYRAHVNYLDLHPGFVDANGVQIGSLFTDGLHPNLDGYRVWRDRLVPFLAKLRSDQDALSAKPPSPQRTTTTGTAAVSYTNATDHALQGVFERREQDWRNGSIVYQVLVDRFVPPSNLEAKRALYPAPKTLHPWSKEAKRGKYVESAHVWSHEIEFWGGDLPGVTSKLGYLQDMGVDVLYLNPIHLGYTNHKYDALDYLQISPEFGTKADMGNLTSHAHAKGMKVVLDGVFNHLGRNSQKFKEAESKPQSPYRDWFFFGDQYPGGARGWFRATNLPELQLENQAVRDHVYATHDSVVQTWLREGIDGWRLDVAPELGPQYLQELTQAAHQAKPGSLVVGEIPNYPKEWFPSVDAVMNFTFRDIILNTVNGAIAPATSAAMLDRTVTEAGIEPILKSWVLLDNHDNDRLAHVLPRGEQQRLAQILQFTLPGAPNLYYGSELGMTGGEDPANRSPMRWDLAKESNPHLRWTKQLIQLRKSHRALRIGNFRLVTADKLLAFERYTDRVADTVVVLANPTKKAVTERVLIANSKLMNGSQLVDLLNPKARPVRVLGSLTTVSIPAGGFRVLAPDVAATGGYTVFKRIQ